MSLVKKIAVAIVILAIIALGVGLYLTRTPKSDSNKLQVVASLYPLVFLAEHIGGEHVQVTNLTPAGAEPHDFEPSAQDSARIESSDLVLLNGAGLEPWAVGLTDELQARGVVVVEVGQGVADRTLQEEGQSILDPHVWLSPKLMVQMAQSVGGALTRVDPQNAAYYAAGVAQVRRDLEELDAAFAAGLARCVQRDLVTAHNAFSYLATAYDLRPVPITGVEPEHEPSTQELAELTEFIRQNEIDFIFFEKLVSPKLAETLAREAGAKTLVLDPLEGLSDDDRAQGKDYLSVMRDNLTNLQTALECRT